MPNKLTQLLSRLSSPRGSKQPDNNTVALSKKDKQVVLRVIRRQEPIIRRDIASWRTARQEATRADNPKQHRLQVLYDEVMLDAKMTSQIGLRISKSQAADWFLKKGDANNEEAMNLLKDTGLFDKLVNYIVESKFYSQSLVQFTFDKEGNPDIELVPRANVSPASGMFYPDVTGN